MDRAHQVGPRAATSAAAPAHAQAPVPGPAPALVLVLVLVLTLIAVGSLAACGPPPSGSGAQPATTSGTARILLAGDVMLGRGVASRTAGDPSAALAGVRDVVRAADLAAANLESPLTAGPHDPAAGPNALEAPPSAARPLADAGFDALGVANNHAGDAGPGTVTDTMAALRSARLTGIGGGRSASDAFAARILPARGLRIALLAVDATGAGPRAGGSAPGVAWWDEARLRAAVRDARHRADVVVVGLHGGTEYLTRPDPAHAAHAAALAGWGVDVVWGHHPHVAQPVTTIDPDRDGRPTLVATSLGNLLFDQHTPGTDRGLLLEVLVGRDGVRAVRRGEVAIARGAASFTRWLAPEAGADAAMLHGTWWRLTAGTRLAVGRPDAPTRAALAATLSPGRLLDAALGDVDGDGATEVVAAFRRPYRPTPVSRTLPLPGLVDAQGRSAHVGLYRPAGPATEPGAEPGTGLKEVWVAGSVLEPVNSVAACDGWLAVGLTRLNDATTVGVGAWRWGGFGFITYPDLSGPGRPACADVDGNGSLEPLAVERTAP